MAKRRVFSQLEPGPRRMEKMNQKSITETTGYIPEHIRIKKLFQAGEILSDFRKETYDFGGTDIVPEGFLDPTRNSNFDMADATRIARENNHRYKDAKKRADESGKTEEAARAEGISSGEISPENIPDGTP